MNVPVKCECCRKIALMHRSDHLEAWVTICPNCYYTEMTMDWATNDASGN